MQEEPQPDSQLSSFAWFFLCFTSSLLQTSLVARIFSRHRGSVSGISVSLSQLPNSCNACLVYVYSISRGTRLDFSVSTIALIFYQKANLYFLMFILVFLFTTQYLSMCYSNHFECLTYRVITNQPMLILDYFIEKSVLWQWPYKIWRNK